MSWVLVVDSTLTNAINLGCAIPLESFTPTTIVNARFIRFTSKSHYGGTGGIQFISWEADESKLKFEINLI